MANPLEALRGAQSIRPTPSWRERLNEAFSEYAEEPVMGESAGPPWGAGMRAAVQAGAKVLPFAQKALQGLQTAGKGGLDEGASTLGSRAAEYAAVGGEDAVNIGRIGSSRAGTSAANEAAFSKYTNQGPGSFVRPGAMPEGPMPPATKPYNVKPASQPRNVKPATAPDRGESIREFHKQNPASQFESGGGRRTPISDNPLIDMLPDGGLGLVLSGLKHPWSR